MDRTVGCYRLIMFWVALHKLKLAENGLDVENAGFELSHDWYHDDEIFRNFGGPVEICKFCRATRMMP